MLAPRLLVRVRAGSVVRAGTAPRRLAGARYAKRGRPAGVRGGTSPVASGVSHASGGHVTVAPVGRCRAGQAVVRRSGPRRVRAVAPGDGLGRTASWRRSGRTTCSSTSPCSSSASTAAHAGRPALGVGRGRGGVWRGEWTVPFDGSVTGPGVPDGSAVTHQRRAARSRLSLVSRARRAAASSRSRSGSPTRSSGCRESRESARERVRHPRPGDRGRGARGRGRGVLQRGRLPPRCPAASVTGA